MIFTEAERASLLEKTRKMTFSKQLKKHAQIWMAKHLPKDPTEHPADWGHHGGPTAAQRHWKSQYLDSK